MNITDTIKCECCGDEYEISKLIKITNRGIFCMRCIDTETYKLHDGEKKERLELWKQLAYKNRRNTLKKYGILPEDYDQMYIEQEGKCAVCGTHQSSMKKKLVVDHCHKTGKVRGLLCNHCNSLLGFSRDNIATLNGAISYLKK